jgi:GNAT superfamily N-acetyltransferase
MMQAVKAGLRVRLAKRKDLEWCRSIEIEAGQRFRDYGLDFEADDDPPSIATLAAYADDGRAWVAVNEVDQPVGYFLIEVVDHGGHIEQVSVVPAFQGEGVGKALIGEARRWAIDRRLECLTLTTFVHVPWNQPLYEHLGFTVLTSDQLSPGLRVICDAETARGLDPNLRVAMVSQLP